MEVKCYRTETYYVHDMRELERLEGENGSDSSLSFHLLNASVTELADVSASEADVFMALRVRVPPLAFLTDRILQRRMTIRLHAPFVFVVLTERSGIFRDTTILRQGMWTKQELP